LCGSAGSELDADALRAARRDAETLATQQRYIGQRKA
jgi:hypothetical protein